MSTDSSFKKWFNNSVRADYKLQRNLKIYEEYSNSKVSLNELAKKYSVSPQRIKYIVDEFKTNELADKLAPDDVKEKREAYKNDAVVKRQNGKLALALKMFDEVVKWDEAHANLRGKVDVLGHKKITLTLLADKTSRFENKRELISEARRCIEEALTIAQNNPDIPSGPAAIQKVHIASLLLRESEFLAVKEAGLTQALKIVNEAIDELPGSIAHKAWPLVTKAKILYALQKKEEAIDALLTAQKYLYLGYEEELGWAKTRVEKVHADAKLNLIGDDQAKMKLRVWSSGISECFAEILEKEHKDILAEIYAAAVLKTPDPENILKSRKLKATLIIKRIKNKNI